MVTLNLESKNISRRNSRIIKVLLFFPHFMSHILFINGNIWVALLSSSRKEHFALKPKGTKGKLGREGNKILLTGITWAWLRAIT